VATCAGLDAEALYSTRSPAAYEQVRADRREAYEYLPTDDGHWQRAFDAQCLLARTGRHRAVGIVDLLTAVLAAEHGVTIVRYDADFEMAAEVLEFEHRWVLPRGTVKGDPDRCASVVSEGRHATYAHGYGHSLRRAVGFPSTRRVDDAGTFPGRR